MQFGPYLWPKRLWTRLWGRYYVPPNVFLVRNASTHVTSAESTVRVSNACTRRTGMTFYRHDVWYVHLLAVTRLMSSNTSMVCKLFFTALNSNISVAKYLSNIVIIIILLQFFNNSENDSKLIDWINCPIYLKIYFRILGLCFGSVALALHVSGLGLMALALTTLALLTSLFHV